MKNNILIEVVINNSVEDAIKVSKYPVDRIELVNAVELNALTPSIGCLTLIKEKIPNLKVVSMIRPRPGDFVYSDLEFECMLKDAINQIDNGADGIVFGCLTNDKHININQTKKLIDLAHKYGKESVFHKGFDSTIDLFESAKTLVELGIDRILSNGNAKDSDLKDGTTVLAKLQEIYVEKVQFLLGGGINDKTVADSLMISHCKQIHLTAKTNNEKGYICVDENVLDKVIKNIK